jgi:hypothetical protein
MLNIMEERFTDNFGHEMELPSNLKVCECHYCKRTATRSALLNVITKLKTYRDRGWLLELAGFIEGLYPICIQCRGQQNVKVKRG